MQLRRTPGAMVLQGGKILGDPTSRTVGRHAATARHASPGRPTRSTPPACPGSALLLLTHSHTALRLRFSPSRGVRIAAQRTGPVLGTQFNLSPNAPQLGCAGSGVLRLRSDTQADHGHLHVTDLCTVHVQTAMMQIVHGPKGEGRRGGCEVRAMQGSFGTTCIPPPPPGGHLCPAPQVWKFK